MEKFSIKMMLTTSKFSYYSLLSLPSRNSFQRLLSHHSLLSIPNPLETQKLCEIVTGFGNLDDLEANLEQSPITITPTIITQVIDFCKDHSHTRRLLRFFSWSRRKHTCSLGDEAFNHVFRVFLEKKDLRAVDILISELKKERRKMEIQTWGSLVETLVNCGKEDEAVGLFKHLEKLNCPKDRVSSTLLINALCTKGHARRAESVVWHLKEQLPTEPCIYKSLLYGWCVHGNAKEARRIIDEMKSQGFCPGLVSYNTFLRCICKRNLKFNPSALVQEAKDLLIEMRSTGVSPTAISFNILISHLGRVRRVKEACKVLFWMREWGCDPDWVSYYLVARVLYLTGRIGRGNAIVDQMIEEGLTPEARFYHGLIGVLCGVEKVGHGLAMFERMKNSGLQDYGPVYDLLIAKLCRGGEFDKGRELWDEAVQRGVILQCSSDLLDPLKTEVFKPTMKGHQDVPLVIKKKRRKKKMKTQSAN